MIVRVRAQGTGGSWKDWPAAPGSYVLVLRLEEFLPLRIGALGTFGFPAGEYLYCGSALGAGGVRARVRRHVEGGRKRHWHIDYLLRLARVHEVWGRLDPRRLECAWAQALSRHGSFACPAARFGASDCRCPAHLWRAEVPHAGLESVLRRLPAPPRPLWPGESPADML
ncbi:MAG: GIY-YIG nuclease family protein [Acidobacteriota bacterium]